MKNISRRKTLVLFGTGVLFSQGVAQTSKPKAVRLVAPEQFDKPLEFTFDGLPCLLQRVPVPKATTPRVLVVGNSAFAAVSRLCSHGGCQTELPKIGGFHECPCHHSLFTALGEVIGGIARTPLQGIQLELREKAIWAVALIG